MLGVDKRCFTLVECTGTEYQTAKEEHNAGAKGRWVVIADQSKASVK